MLRWRSRCHAGDDGDHDGASEMEITSTRWWWPYHITYIDCMWCLSFYASYLALIDGSNIRWSLTKLSRSVLPEYAPLPKFVVPRPHRIITWCLGTTNCSNGAYSGRALIPLKFSERSSYNDTAVLSKIRCIKDKHHMQSKICDMIWSSSSRAFDLHLQSIVMISIVTGLTPWSPSLCRGRLANYC